MLHRFRDRKFEFVSEIYSIFTIFVIVFTQKIVLELSYKLTINCKKNSQCQLKVRYAFLKKCFVNIYFTSRLHDRFI